MTSAAIPTMMRAWQVARPGPVGTEPLGFVSIPVPHPDGRSFLSPCVPAECAPPICMSPRATSQRTGTGVLPALEALDRGGTLAIAGIHLSDIPALNYQRHLFQERQIRSVSSNTRADTRALLDFVGEHHNSVTTPEYPLSQANRALSDLSAGRISGAAVLLV